MIGKKHFNKLYEKNEGNFGDHLNLWELLLNINIIFIIYLFIKNILNVLKSWLNNNFFYFL